MGTRFHHDPLLANALKGLPVAVVADDQALTWAVNARREGTIPFLMVGPNVITMPDDLERIGALDSVDLIVVPSDWVANLHREVHPVAADKIRTWQAGTDVDYWSPSPSVTRHPRGRYLLYIKTDDGELVERTRRAIERRGHLCEFVRYGHYRPVDYLIALRRSDAVVVLGGSESQGLALQEAWATGVPTLVHRPKGGELRLPLGRRIAICGTAFSPAPLLTGATGALWHEDRELHALLDTFDQGAYSAREWMLAHLTLEHSARRFVELLGATEPAADAPLHPLEP